MSEVSIADLKKKLNNIALSFAFTTVIILAGTYLLTAYNAESFRVHDAARSISNEISQLVYGFPDTWQFQTERLMELATNNSLFGQNPENNYYLQIHETSGKFVLDIGSPVGFPSISETATIKDGHEIIANLTVTHSVLHIWQQALVPGLLGILLGIAIYIILQILPMSALLRRESQLRTSEIQLRQAQKMEAVGQISRGVAHDFNNLLGIIIGHLELLEESLKTDVQKQKLVQTALHAATRGASLTNRLLSFSSQQTLRPETVNLNVMVNRMWSLLQDAISKKIVLEIQTSDDLWKTELDPAQFEAAILNLITNAEYSMPERGTLTIATQNRIFKPEDKDKPSDLTPGPYVAVSISDTGRGMSDEVLSKAIEPFFTTKTFADNSGLGLSMVHGFAEQSNGALVIESKLGLGTTVILYFHAMVPERAQIFKTQTQQIPST